MAVITSISTFVTDKGKEITKISLDGQAPMPLSLYLKPKGWKPETGMHIEPSFDKTDEWITQVKIIAQPTPAPTTNGHKSQPDQSNGTQQYPGATTPPAPTQSPAPKPNHERPDREICITRMACLNTATAILSAGNRPVDITSVLSHATILEQWIVR